MSAQRILVIDDERDLRGALKTALESAGMEVLEATDGATGLKVALTEKPDLILLDINMPGMSGHEMLSVLRNDTWGKDADVILLTNADDATNITKGVERETNDYVIKSQHSLAEITKKVKQHLAGYY